jgi:hypothetical protein
MRIHDLYGDLFESAPSVSKVVAGLPPSFQHSMPATHSFPDIDNYYGFYRFVIAMAGEPDDSNIPLQSNMRDIPLAVAYTKQEHDMIHKTARRMGSKAIELAYQGSHELPDTYTKSPVMKFKMDENQQHKLAGLIKLSEAMTHEAE